jgi:hypothetical protein
VTGSLERPAAAARPGDQTGPDGGCWLHRTHRPQPLQLVVHHAWPRGMGGPDAGGNRYLVCDTGHRSTHVILAWLIFGLEAGAPDPGGTRRERQLARIGLDAWTAAGRPGNPHAAYALHNVSGGAG